MLPNPVRVRDVVAVVIVVLAWGSSYSFIAMALPVLGAGPLAMARFGVASGLLLGLATLRGVRLPAPADLPRLALVSLSGITAYHLLLNTGQQVVPPPTTAFLIQTAPVFTALFASLAGLERVTARTWAGIGVALAGATVLVVARRGPLVFAGSAVLILGCAVCTAFYFVFSRPLTLRYGAIATTTYTAVLGTVPFTLFAPQLAAALPGAPAPALLSALWLGVVPGALAYPLWIGLIGRFGASRMAPLLYLTPLVAMGSDLVRTGQGPDAATIAGGLVVVAGVAIVQARR